MERLGSWNVGSAESQKGLQARVHFRSKQHGVASCSEKKESTNPGTTRSKGVAPGIAQRQSPSDGRRPDHISKGWINSLYSGMISMSPNSLRRGQRKMRLLTCWKAHSPARTLDWSRMPQNTTSGHIANRNWSSTSHQWAKYKIGHRQYESPEHQWGLLARSNFYIDQRQNLLLNEP